MNQNPRISCPTGRTFFNLQVIMPMAPTKIHDGANQPTNDEPEPSNIMPQRDAW